MGATDLRATGRTAIRQAALAHGLPAELTILSERWNTVARLGNTGVVAKAAPIGHLARQDTSRWYQQELDICRLLVARGAPVQPPFADSVLFAPGSDIPVSLW